MLAVFISMIRNCNGFKVKVTKYQLNKQIGLLLNKSRQYNILGFDLGLVYTLNLIQTNLIQIKFVDQSTISRRAF